MPTIEVTPEILIDQSELRLFLCPRGRPRRPECQQGGERRAIAIRRHPFALSRRSGETPLAGTRLTKDGVLVIFARAHRSQERNRQDACERLLRLIAAAAEKPEFRVKTRPGVAARERRIETKVRRGQTKRLRNIPVE